MESRGIELLIVTDPANMAWLSGYDGWSFYVPQCVAVPLAEPPLWFGREQDANGARRTVYFPPSRIAEYADDYIHNPPRHAMQKLCEVIQDFALPIKTIGVESDSFYFTAASRDALAQGLPESKFIDATTLVNWERIIKSPQELKYMRRAAKLAEAAHRRISDGLPLAPATDFLSLGIFRD